MKLIKWYVGKVKQLQKLPVDHFFLFLAGKVLGAMALGMLVASYVRGVNWTPIALIVFAVAVLMTIGPWAKIMFGK